MSNQFQNHPIVSYGGRQVRDFTRHARFFERVRDNDRVCADYVIQEGETPTQLAQDFYGDPNVFWILMNLNNMINPWFDWPMAYNDLVEYTRAKYDIEDVYQTAFYGFDDYWISSDRLIEAVINFDQFTTISEFQDAASPMSYIEFEGMMNDANRYIRVIRPEEIENVLDDYREEIRA